MHPTPSTDESLNPAGTNPLPQTEEAICCCGHGMCSSRERVEEKLRLAGEFGQHLLSQQDVYITELRKTRELLQEQKEAKDVLRLTLIQAEGRIRSLGEEKDQLERDKARAEQEAKATVLDLEHAEIRVKKLLQDIEAQQVEIERLSGAQARVRQATEREESFKVRVEKLEEELASARKSEIATQARWKKLKMKYDGLANEYETMKQEQQDTSMSGEQMEQLRWLKEMNERLREKLRVNITQSKAHEESLSSTTNKNLPPTPESLSHQEHASSSALFTPTRPSSQTPQSERALPEMDLSLQSEFTRSDPDALLTPSPSSPWSESFPLGSSVNEAHPDDGEAGEKSKPRVKQRLFNFPVQQPRRRTNSKQKVVVHHHHYHLLQSQLNQLHPSTLSPPLEASLSASTSKSNFSENSASSDPPSPLPEGDSKEWALGTSLLTEALQCTEKQRTAERSTHEDQWHNTITQVCDEGAKLLQQLKASDIRMVNRGLRRPFEMEAIVHVSNRIIAEVMQQVQGLHRLNDKSDSTDEEPCPTNRKEADACGDATDLSKLVVKLVVDLLLEIGHLRMTGNEIQAGYVAAVERNSQLIALTSQPPSSPHPRAAALTVIPGTSYFSLMHETRKMIDPVADGILRSSGAIVKRLDRWIGSWKWSEPRTNEEENV
ncbi:uncharacterized protein VTP21DRAFT_6709 [Calcarisporiella thermophila]|uniref:uncharacterized protein n=1 Tax=Calcarisporiella thermophila TaxID=911321 RepID=UPI003743C61A